MCEKVQICQNCQNSFGWFWKHKLSNLQLMSFIYKLNCIFEALFEWISHWFICKFGFSIDRNSKHYFDIFHILLTWNGRNLRIEHATSWCQNVPDLIYNETKTISQIWPLPQSASFTCVGSHILFIFINFTWKCI